MSALPIEVETKDLEVRALAWPDRARAIVISDDQTFIAAGDFVTEIKSLRKEIDSTFDPIIAAAHKAHQEAISQKRRHEAPLAEAEMIIKKSLTIYRDAQERRAAEERRRLEDEARKREEDRRLAEAQELQDSGDVAAADEIISEPIAPPPVKVAPITPKVASVQFRETWQFSIENLHELVKHVAAHPEDLNLLQANTTAVRQMVNARKSACRIPGVKVWSEKSVAAGGRR